MEPVIAWFNAYLSSRGLLGPERTMFYLISTFTVVPMSGSVEPIVYLSNLDKKYRSQTDQILQNIHQLDMFVSRFSGTGTSQH